MKYTTETGYYVIRDSEQRVIGRAAVPAGTHPIDDSADPEECFDVENHDELTDYVIDEKYRDEF